MKKWLVGVFLAMVSVIAFALPSPKMIEGALQNGNYSDARSMVQQVLEEKPDSARAHLLNAYILIHVDHNKQAAAQEVDTARRLDNKGDVKNSPLFGRVTAEIDLTKNAQAVVKPAPVTQAPQVSYSPQPAVQQAPPQHSGGHGFLIFLIIVVIIGIVAYLFIRGATRRETVVETRYVPPVRDAANVSSGYSGLNSVPAYTPPQRVVYHEPAPVVVQQAPQQGLGFGGQFAATAGGVVAGELIHDALVKPHRSSLRDDDDYYERRRRERERESSSSAYDSTPVQTYSEPKPVSYASESQSFSSGSDDSWSSRSSSSDSSSSYSSSSSSSSWDSGSSSSYDSGSSSYDSGSSSSSSDW